jgi:hypothetical protein
MSGPSPFRAVFTLPCRQRSGALRCASRLTGSPVRRVAFNLLCVIAFATTGCGYHWSDSGPGAVASDPDYKWPGLYRQDVKTVAVPVFANRTYYRGVEFNLTKAVINQLESRTPYKVVPKEQADTILEGEVISAGVHFQSRSQIMGLPQEQLYYLVVNFTWKDMRTGQQLTVRHGFEQTSPYYPTLAEDQFAGSQDSVERLALAIVEELQANWGNTATTKPLTP